MESLKTSLYFFSFFLLYYSYGDVIKRNVMLVALSIGTLPELDK